MGKLASRWPSWVHRNGGEIIGGRGRPRRRGGGGRVGGEGAVKHGSSD